jgi:hypothetical protein
MLVSNTKHQRHGEAQTRDEGTKGRKRRQAQPDPDPEPKPKAKLPGLLADPGVADGLGLGEARHGMAKTETERKHLHVIIELNTNWQVAGVILLQSPAEHVHMVIRPCVDP